LRFNSLPDSSITVGILVVETTVFGIVVAVLASGWTAIFSKIHIL